MLQKGGRAESRSTQEGVLRGRGERERWFEGGTTALLPPSCFHCPHAWGVHSILHPHPAVWPALLPPRPGSPPTLCSSSRAPSTNGRRARHAPGLPGPSRCLAGCCGGGQEGRGEGEGRGRGQGRKEGSQRWEARVRTLNLSPPPPLFLSPSFSSLTHTLSHIFPPFLSPARAEPSIKGPTGRRPPS